MVLLDYVVMLRWVQLAVSYQLAARLCPCSGYLGGRVGETKSKALDI